MSALEERVFHVVYGPHVTEKAVSGSDSNIHVFKVAINASKNEIKKSVELLFEVKVEDVRTVNVKGKAKKAAGSKKSSGAKKPSDGNKPSGSSNNKGGSNKVPKKGKKGNSE